MKAEAIVLSEDEQTVIFRKVISSYEEYHNLRIEYSANRVGLQSIRESAEQQDEADFAEGADQECPE